MHKQYHGVTVNDMYNAFYKTFNGLVDELLNYESDTFSSEGSELTASEAEQIAFSMVCKDMQAKIDMQTLDGTMVDSELYDLRNPNND